MTARVLDPEAQDLFERVMAYYEAAVSGSTALNLQDFAVAIRTSSDSLRTAAETAVAELTEPVLAER